MADQFYELFHTCHRAGRLKFLFILKVNHTNNASHVSFVPVATTLDKQRTWIQQLE